MRAQDETPAVLMVPGPNGVSLRFSGPEQGYYRHAEVLRPGHNPVPIHFLEAGGPSDVVLVSGDDADGNNHIFKFKLHRDLPWSLRVWSLDGRYVVLITYVMSNGEIDIRNARYTSAYDTTTGFPVEFRGKSGSLSNDSFKQWSPTKSGVALLFSGINAEVEEAYPVKE